MKFMIALHDAENWWFFPHWREDCDTSDPRYVGLYVVTIADNSQVLPDYKSNPRIASRNEIYRILTKSFRR